ncbi:MAG TPA: fumarylacetoacetate hydrolase family protein [Candidatus Elarobacter sp.]
MNETVDVTVLAAALEAAERDGVQIAPLIASVAFDARTAYAIQRETARRRIARGDARVGMKVGLTSEPMQRMLGVDEPDFGHLFASMRVEDGASFPIAELLQPRVEAEIAIVLKSELRGPGVTDADVLAACDYVAPALEIIDSRIRDWKISLSDTIADNGSSARFVIGAARVAPAGIDLPAIAMTFTKNGETIGTGLGSAVLGSGPLRAVAWLANTLADTGLVLAAGDVVLPGALSAAVPAAAGDTFRATFTAGLGDTTVSFV